MDSAAVQTRLKAARADEAVNIETETEPELRAASAGELIDGDECVVPPLLAELSVAVVGPLVLVPTDDVFGLGVLPTAKQISP